MSLERLPILSIASLVMVSLKLLMMMVNGHRHPKASVDLLSFMSLLTGVLIMVPDFVSTEEGNETIVCAYVSSDRERNVTFYFNLEPSSPYASKDKPRLIIDCNVIVLYLYY